MLLIPGFGGYGLAGAFFVMQPVFLNPKIQADFDLPKEEMALQGSLFFLGWAVGAFLLTKLADTYGRRKIMFLALVVTIGISLVALCSPNFIFYALCRMILGGSLGGFGILI